jgi:hypothetical protein
LLLAPALGPAGRLIAFRNDPAGHLVDVISPTELRLGPALANYGAALIIVMAGVLGLFALLARRMVRGIPAGELTEGGLDADTESGSGQPVEAGTPPGRNGPKEEGDVEAPGGDQRSEP